MPPPSLQPQFTEVLTLIQSAQHKVVATINQELIKLYWNIGKYINDRLAKRSASHQRMGLKTIAFQIASALLTQFV